MLKITIMITPPSIMVMIIIMRTMIMIVLMKVTTVIKLKLLDLTHPLPYLGSPTGPSWLLLLFLLLFYFIDSVLADVSCRGTRCAFHSDSISRWTSIIFVQNHKKSCHGPPSLNSPCALWHGDKNSSNSLITILILIARIT